MFVSETEPILVTSIFGGDEINITVGSLSVFPSLSFPSSLRSFTSFVPSGLLATAFILFITLPLSTDCWSIINEALNVSVPDTSIDIEEEPEVALTNVNESVNDNALRFPSLKLSLSVRPVKVWFPLLWIVTVYSILSPKSFIPFPLLSITFAVLVTSMDGNGSIITVVDSVEEISTTVGSSVVFPSPSSPSSEVSETLLDWPGLLATAIALLTILVVLAAWELITYNPL